MDTIWAPWRVTYIEMAKPKGCILCDKPKENKDAENYIVFRGKHSFIILNAFPYNPGHLMVAPYRHVPSPEDLNPEELLEHSHLINRCLGALRETFASQDFNIGMNLGTVAGAGIPGHMHSHIVPRFTGDTNFMPVLADIKVVPQALKDTYNKLKTKL